MPYIVRKIIWFCRRYFKLHTNFRIFKRLSDNRFSLDWNDRYLFFNDATKETSFDKHYLYHTAWAARILAETRPDRHIDIASSLYFISIASAFVPVEFYDYRPPNLILDNLQCGFADLTKLSFATDSIPSLSCMHVVEHIGLGRFGDPIDPLGDITAMKELSRVLKPGGNLLFAVPVGNTQKIMFNAHRIYDKNYIINTFESLDLRLLDFTLIQNSTEKTGLISNPDDSLLLNEDYACGCFWFTK